MKQNWLERTVLARVGRHHFAFLRGYLDGLDLRALAERYLDIEDAARGDLRVAKSTLKWIQEQLAVVAKRMGKPSIGRAVRIAPETLRAAPASAVPSLEEFREERDPHDMYSEAELLELFAEAYPAGSDHDRQSRRKERLRRRQVDALKVLEPLFDVDPQKGDRIAAWLHPSLAGRLADAGIVTIEQLVTTINKRGFRWWKDVPQFGEKAAAQVVRWLKRPENEASIGLRVESQGTTPLRQLLRKPRADRMRSYGVVPLEYLKIPEQLQGTNGVNAGARCQHQVDNDLEIVNKWLGLRPAGTHTWRSYRCHVERFLLFVLVARKRRLTDMNADDCVAYVDFLRRLNPASDGPDDTWPFEPAREAWVAPYARKIPRLMVEWRPFEGPLDARSQKLAVVVAKLFCTWLVEVDYLYVNPWASLPKDDSIQFSVDRTRSLPPTLFHFTFQYLETLPKDANYYRLRFAFLLAYGTGMRLSELVSARIDHLKRSSDSHGDIWKLSVLGKRSKVREVPIPAIVMAELDMYLAQRNLPPRPMCAPETYLIDKLPKTAATTPGASIDGVAASVEKDPAALTKPKRKVKPGLSASMLYQVFKEFFEKAAAELLAQADRERAQADARRGDLAVASVYYDRFSRMKEAADKLEQASTHWLRHTYATHFAESGRSLRDLQQLLGHARGTTTEVYTKPDADRLYRVVEEFIQSGPLVHSPGQALLPSGRPITMGNDAELVQNLE